MKVNPLLPILLFLFSIILLMAACNNDPGSNDPNPMQPDSELALLMREMFDDAMVLKQKVKAGEKLEGLKRFEEIHSAVPTDPNVSGSLFDSFAQAYVESVRELEEADTNSVVYFNNMVDVCMSCHTEFCPGPKMRIKKLYVKE